MIALKGFSVLFRYVTLQIANRVCSKDQSVFTCKKKKQGFSLLRAYVSAHTVAMQPQPVLMIFWKNHAHDD